MVYVCETRYRVRDLNCLQAKTWGGGGSFTLPGGLWLYEGPQANGLGRGTERDKPIPCLAGGVFINKRPIRNYQCTLV